MSCNGCRVLRKGCSDTCILRPCLQWIDTPHAQGHATLFVAKFFGRAGLMSFISNVPHNQRPALFQSLLYEACGRTINPITGAVGLLWSGNWNLCQAAAETVLRGGTLKSIPEFLVGAPSTSTTPDANEASEVFCFPKRRKQGVEKHLTPSLAFLQGPQSQRWIAVEKHQPGTPSFNSEESDSTVGFESELGGDNHCYQVAVAVAGAGVEPELLNLFS